MTLGERILTKRKELGLSQEDLGNKLDVSRQTVYKWESDQAVPELGKLIVLAKIFDVKIGWLINEEADNPDATAANAEEAYNKAAERLIKLLEESEKREKPQAKSSVFKLFTAALVIVLIFGIIKIASLEKRYRELDSTIFRNNNYLQQQISGITNSVSSMLNNYNSVTTNAEAIISGIDFSKNMISFEVSAKPKTYINGMTAVFHVKMDGKIYDFEGTDKGGKDFSVTASVPLVDDMAEISVEFISGDTSENCSISTFYDLLGATFPFYDITCPFEDWIKPDYSGFSQAYFEVDTWDMFYDYLERFGITRPKIVSMEAFLTEDGIRIADYTYDEAYSVQQNGTGVAPNGMYWHYFKRPADIKLTQGKTYVEHFIATDEYGRQLEVMYNDRDRIVEYHVK